MDLPPTPKPRQVEVKSTREQMAAAVKPAPPDTPPVEFSDRADLTADWYDRKTKRNCHFEGEIRVLGAPELMKASTMFIRVTGGVPFEMIPTELRNRLWPQAKLTVMLEGQRGADQLIDAMDYDKPLLALVVGEVDKLEAACFRNLLAESEGVEGAPRVVVTSRPAVATATPTAPPR